MNDVNPLKPIVMAAGLSPKGRCRVAIALAELHDTSERGVTATMAAIAELASLSTTQARRHVRALVSIGLLRVVRNAYGGQPGVAPEYAFNRGVLTQMAERNLDLFLRLDQEHTAPISDGYPFQAGGLQFVAFLVGNPGTRRVVFWRVEGELRKSYGDVQLAVLLRDYRVRGAWHGYLAINGDEDAPIETMVGLTPGEITALAAWAQAAALGRTESVETA